MKLSMKILNVEIANLPIEWDYEHADLETHYQLKRKNGPGQPRRKNIRAMVLAGRRRKIRELLLLGLNPGRPMWYYWP